ncbi:MAG: hypothetical protein QNJ53_17640 [Pleurocapsa sp. MO_192.B19]|nr:hypothetical protein [Pleurocapsa sp. MO_192.B19]
MKTIKLCLLLLCLIYLVSCGQVNIDNSLSNYSLDTLRDRFSNTAKSVSLDTTKSNLAETATPTIIRELNQELKQFTPQVKIISPQAEQVFNKTDINVELKVEDLPIFQDDKLKLGLHLDLILDNEPSQEIYDLDKPIILENLNPGTHSIRVFASRPWGESFKNEGAYAQTTFSVLTETNNNRPEPNLPLLTYSKPTGTYGAEPFMLDFYLTNAPLHAVAQNDPELKDWRVKTTVNGTSFILENWQPIYLTGLNKGENWIKLELIDEAGNNIQNTFNNTVRVINYDPQQTDTLAKLITNKIPLTEARSIVEQNYYIQPVGIPEIIEPEIEPKNNNIETENIPEEMADTSKPTIESTEDNQNIVFPSTDNNTSSETKIKSDKINQLQESTASEVNNATAMDNVDKVKAKEEVISQDKEVKDTFTETSSVINKETEPEKSVVQTTTLESEKSTEPITIEKINSSTEEPLTTIDIPQPESIKITKKKITIIVPEIESINTSEP